MDNLSKEHRSWTMSHIKSKDTAPELYIRSLLHRNGFRFRLHVKELPGKPDIVLPKYKTIVEVRGCFWHQHKNCKRATIPATDTKYWSRKFKKNISRDKTNQKKLELLGWRVVVIWECELKKAGERLLNTLNISKENFRKQMKCVDLFAGCGGMSLGFLQAGFSLLAAFDNWDDAINCYHNNFETSPVFKFDLSKWKKAINYIMPYKPDIITGGPPCQDFSKAGNRIEGERAELTISFAKIIANIKPKYFVMENVPLAQKSSAYAIAKSIFKKANYGLTEKVLDACLCGAPQKRKRFFCIGSLNDRDGFLVEEINSHLADKPLSVKEYLGDEIDFDYYYKHPRTYKRKAIYSVNEPATTIRGCNRPLPHNYKKHKNDAAEPFAVRALTTQELGRLQTFPKSFCWPSSNSVATQLIANAVPVALAKYIAIAICEYDTKQQFR